MGIVRDVECRDNLITRFTKYAITFLAETTISMPLTAMASSMSIVT